MAQYPMSRQAVTTVLDTVREHMRSEHARLMEQQTRLVRRCILLSVPFALLQLPALALNVKTFFKRALLFYWGRFTMNLS